jgi:hypothetical protein
MLKEHREEREVFIQTSKTHDERRKGLWIIELLSIKSLPTRST